MKDSTNMNMPATPIQDEHDRLSLSEFESLVSKPTTPIFEFPQTDSLHFCWSKPSPTLQQASAEPVQSTGKTLITSDLNYPQTVILPTINSAATQHVITPIQSHSNTSLIPQSIIAPSLATHTYCTNSYTVPLNNPLLAFLTLHFS